MKGILPILIVQLLFGIVLNSKELLIYGIVDVEANETFFLNSDVFKEGKIIKLDIIFSVENFTDFEYPTLNVQYNFSNQNEDYDYLIKLNDSDIERNIKEEKNNITIFNYSTSLTMEVESKYLLLKVYCEDFEINYFTVINDPNSGIIATRLPGYNENYEEINVDEKGCFYKEVYPIKNDEYEIQAEVNFISTKEYDNLKIYFDNKLRINEEFTEELNNIIITDTIKKVNDNYTFYFYLPLYNPNKNTFDNNFLIFRPQSVGENVTIGGKQSIHVGKKVPTYGILEVIKLNERLFYLNIEEFKKGNKFHLQFITINKNIPYFYIKYSFSDENYNEMFNNLDSKKKVSNKNIKGGALTFYISIKVEEDSKYFLFKIDDEPDLQSVTIKHTKKNEYTNTYYIITIVAIIVVVIVIAIIIIVVCVKRRKNKFLIKDIEDSFKESNDIPKELIE